MVAVEKVYLDYFKNNLNNISKQSEFMDVPSKIVKEQISSWSNNNRLAHYYEMTIDIIRHEDLEAILNYLEPRDYQSLKECTSQNGLYDAVMASFYNYYRRIYFIYQLNRLFYILNKYSLSEIKKLDFRTIMCAKPEAAIESTFNKENFIKLLFSELEDLKANRESYDNRLWFTIDRRLYLLKEFYIRRINSQLEEEEFVSKLRALKRRLKVINQSEDSYEFTRKLEDMIAKNFKASKKKPIAKEPIKSLHFQYSFLP